MNELGSPHLQPTLNQPNSCSALSRDTFVDRSALPFYIQGSTGFHAIACSLSFCQVASRFKCVTISSQCLLKIVFRDLIAKDVLKNQKRPNHIPTPINQVLWEPGHHPLLVPRTHHFHEIQDPEPLIDRRH